MDIIAKRLLDNAGKQARMVAGYNLAAPIKARLGNPTTESIFVDQVNQPEHVWVHGVGGDPQSIAKAVIQNIQRDQLIYKAPVLVRPRANGVYSLESIDPDDYPAYIKGAAVRGNQLPVSIGQLLYGTIQAETAFDGIRYVVTPAWYDGVYVDLLTTADFTASPLDTTGATIAPPAVADSLIYVLVQLDPATKTLSYKQSAVLANTVSGAAAYTNGDLPTADDGKYRVGYVRLATGQTSAAPTDVFHAPEFIRRFDIGAVNIGDLADVDDTTTAPTDGQALLWNAASGLYIPGDAGSTLTIEEEDGTPTGTPNTLKFSNNTLTDNANGSFSVNIPYVFDDLSDVVITSPASGEFIRYDGTEFTNQTANLSALSDVNLGLLLNGQVLRYNGTSFVNSPLSTSDLTDINNFGIADDDLLQYRSAASRYEPVNVNTINVDIGTANGRLTLVSGDPEATGVSGITTLYFTPFNGNKMALFDGSIWKLITFSEISKSLATLSASTVYDVFAYDNAGSLDIEFVAWTNDTTRATALAWHDGVRVKSGDNTRRYIGIIRTDASTQLKITADTLQLANYNNKELHRMNYIANPGLHTYSSTTWRPFDNNTSYRMFAISPTGGFTENSSFSVLMRTSNVATAAQAGIGLNRTNNTDLSARFASTNTTTNQTWPGYGGIVLGAGYSYLQFVQRTSTASDTGTFFNAIFEYNIKF